MNSLANLLKPFLLGFVLNFLKFKGPNQTFSSRIFRVLHTVQSLIFKVLCCSLSQTAHIFYHKLFCLSRTFLKNFFVSLLWSLSSNFYMLPHFFRSVNNFFQSFFNLFAFALQVVSVFQRWVYYNTSNGICQGNLYHFFKQFFQPLNMPDLRWLFYILWLEKITGCSGQPVICINWIYCIFNLTIYTSMKGILNSCSIWSFSKRRPGLSPEEKSPPY